MFNCRSTIFYTQKRLRKKELEYFLDLIFISFFKVRDLICTLLGFLYFFPRFHLFLLQEGDSVCKQLCISLDPKLKRQLKTNQNLLFPALFHLCKWLYSALVTRFLRMHAIRSCTTCNSQIIRLLSCWSSTTTFHNLQFIKIYKFNFISS
jgi:hypothetical protein